MPAPTTELEKQIENAFHYRGNVTITCKGGEKVDAFIYNREFSNPKLPSDRFIDTYLAGSGESRRFPIIDIISVELTGIDPAAGKSYHEWLEKQKAK